jgi:UDP-GlcNAc3NAcA epimerase
VKIVSVVGARPQFIKAAPVSSMVRVLHHEVIIHTGQHYDKNMSALFYGQLGLPQPDYNLAIGSGPHGWQTAQMLAGIEEVLVREEPDWVLVYGDTNSTLAGALAAAKLHVPLAHVEAGLRSYNWSMPEEVNRVLTDRCSQLLFCPSETARQNLHNEGIEAGVHVIGDVMYDAILHFLPRADADSILRESRVKEGEYIVATIHRAENTDKRANLANVLECLNESKLPVILPLHPRTKSAMERYELQFPAHVRAIEPVGYLEMLALQRGARLIMTDSGGIQKEAYILGVPCITLRAETEWVETVSSGWNCLVGRDPGLVRKALLRTSPLTERRQLFGDGQASARIARLLEAEVQA